MTDLVHNYLDEQFYSQIKDIMTHARHKVYRNANSVMVEAYWLIGKSIVEKQGGKEKAEYGKGLIKELSERMTKDFGKGYSKRNLEMMRLLYITFPITQSLPTQLTWTHLQLILRVKNENARNFYINECIECNWSTRQLERQIHSLYYERILSSQDKQAVSQEIYKKDANKMKPEDIIKDPYVLEFLDLKQNNSFYESDLENALIEHIQSFLLELGRGFSFVSRQKRITFDDRHFYIDLVFYNYILKCFVLIDLKIGDLTHQDIGQMQMYVNYYTRELMNEGDHEPIGIILCSDKSESVVKYTLPQNNNQIYTSRYQLYLPSEEEFKMALSSLHYI